MSALVPMKGGVKATETTTRLEGQVNRHGMFMPLAGDHNSDCCMGKFVSRFPISPCHYRVILVVLLLGWVDLDLRCSTILLGQ